MQRAHEVCPTQPFRVVSSSGASIDTDHHIDFDGTSKLGAARYMARLVKETIEIRLHPDNKHQRSRGPPMGKKGQAEVGTCLRPLAHSE
jgi:hypothetical protein